MFPVNSMLNCLVKMPEFILGVLDAQSQHAKPQHVLKANAFPKAWSPLTSAFKCSIYYPCSSSSHNKQHRGLTLRYSNDYIWSKSKHMG